MTGGPIAAEGLLRSVEAIRADVPALRREEAGRPVAYFDGPGGTQVPTAVADAVRAYLVERNANAGWDFASSRETSRVVDDFRLAAADFLGTTPEGVAFGPNMTSLTFRFAAAFARALAPGDRLLVTRLDHRANVDPWLRVAAERGLEVDAIPFRTDGTLDLDSMDSLITSRTRLVAVTAASNAIGTAVDVAKVASRVHAAGARLFVDAVHAAPHLRIDVPAIGCDGLACSPYKFHGPHAGLLWLAPDLLSELDPPRLRPAPQEGPGRWETGTPAYEAMAGTTAAIDWIASLSSPRDGNDVPATPGADRSARLDATYAGLHRRGEILVSRLWDGLSAIDGVTLYGPPPDMPRTPTVAFTHRSVPSRELARRLSDEHAVFVSHGSFYAPDVVADLGVEDASGVVRAGCACYTTEEEVERLIAGVRAVARP